MTCDQCSGTTDLTLTYRPPVSRDGAFVPPQRICPRCWNAVTGSNFVSLADTLHELNEERKR